MLNEIRLKAKKWGFVELQLTDEQSGILSWLRAQATEFYGVMCITTDYAEKSPVYICEAKDLDEVLDWACEDYADWDES
jgi:hypothetical protein